MKLTLLRRARNCATVVEDLVTGSILGPLLFIIFINYFPKSSTYFSTRLYADDSSFTASGSKLDSLRCEINNHLPVNYELLCSNKLTLNLTKTNCLIFFASPKAKLQIVCNITVANVCLEKFSCVKYPGVYIDCHLNWLDHIDYIGSKISNTLSIMVKLKLLVCTILSYLLILLMVVHC